MKNNIYKQERASYSMKKSECLYIAISHFHNLNFTLKD